MQFYIYIYISVNQVKYKFYKWLFILSYIILFQLYQSLYGLYQVHFSYFSKNIIWIFNYTNHYLDFIKSTSLTSLALTFILTLSYINYYLNFIKSTFLSTVLSFSLFWLKFKVFVLPYDTLLFNKVLHLIVYFSVIKESINPIFIKKYLIKSRYSYRLLSSNRMTVY